MSIVSNGCGNLVEIVIKNAGLSRLEATVAGMTTANLHPPSIKSLDTMSFFLSSGDQCLCQKVAVSVFPRASRYDNNVFSHNDPPDQISFGTFITVLSFYRCFERCQRIVR